MTPEKHLIIDYRSAQQLILKRLKPQRKVVTEELPYCLNRISAEQINAAGSLPVLDTALVDGFAIRAEDSPVGQGSGPTVLKVANEVQRGSASKKSLKPHEAIRVWKGCPLPKGANAVAALDHASLLREAGRVNPHKVQLSRRVGPGDHLLVAGTDMKKGDLMVKEGVFLSPRTLGLAAAMGLAKLKVFDLPTVAVLTIGEEWVEPGQKLRPGKVYNSTAPMILTSLMEMGIEPFYVGTSRANVRTVKKRMKVGLKKADILIVTGCPDLYKSAEYQHLLESTGELVIRGARVKPGDAFLFGLVRKKPVFFLPGDAAGALVDFEVFVRPALLNWMGAKEVVRLPIHAALQEGIADLRGVAKFVRAFTWIDNRSFYTIPSGQQAPHFSHSLARANSLIALDEDTDKKEIGDEVDVLML